MDLYVNLRGMLWFGLDLYVHLRGMLWFAVPEVPGNTRLFGDFAADILQKILAGGSHFLDLYGIYMVMFTCLWHVYMVQCYLHGGRH